MRGHALNAGMEKQYWLAKQEPEAYAWETFLKDEVTSWEGVRNYQARNNLRAMKKGDMVLFYASVSTKAVLGVAEVVREAYPDASAEEGDWSTVDLRARKTFPFPVTLEEIKARKELADIALLRQSRLSVMPLPQAAFALLCEMGGL